MSDDPIRAYQDALREYDAARTAAKEVIDCIDKTSAMLRSYLPFFLHQAFNLQPFERLNRPQTQDRVPNLNHWPDIARLQAIVTAWHGAFVALRQAWDAIPPDNRIGITPPPQSLNG